MKIVELENEINKQKKKDKQEMTVTFCSEPYGDWVFIFRTVFFLVVVEISHYNLLFEQQTKTLQINWKFVKKKPKISK